MRRWVYPLLSLAAFVAASTGLDILARIEVGGETFKYALREQLYYAGVADTIYMAAPFLLVGLICAAIEKRARTRSTMAALSEQMHRLVRS